VREDGMALQHAHEDFMKSSEVVLIAVNRNGLALEYAHEDLKNDRDIVKAAVQQNVNALKYAHEDLQEGPCFLARAAVCQRERPGRVGMTLRLLGLLYLLCLCMFLQVVKRMLFSSSCLATGVI
jgi:hypothetical protein